MGEEKASIVLNIEKIVIPEQFYSFAIRSQFFGESLCLWTVNVTRVSQFSPPCFLGTEWPEWAGVEYLPFSGN